MYPDDYRELDRFDVIVLDNLREKIKQGNQMTVKIKGSNKEIPVQHALSERQVDIILQGGLINWVKK